MADLTSDIVTYTEARNNLKSVMDKVWDDSAPVVITRSGGKHVVMMSKEAYDSIRETEYLLSSKENTRQLRRAMKDVKEGKNLVTYTADEWRQTYAKPNKKR